REEKRREERMVENERVRVFIDDLGLVGSLAGRTSQAKNTHPNGQGTCPTKSSNFILDLQKTLRRPERTQSFLLVVLDFVQDPLTPQVVSATKLPILNPNEVDLWKIRIEQYFLMTDYSLWEVILNGDSLVPTRIIEGVSQPVAPTTAE
nr:hypothetical protein [Tanacetum cinerariifolium]